MGYQVTGIDNLNDYYEVSLKEARLMQLDGLSGFTFRKLDLSDEEGIKTLFEQNQFDFVVNLAAQAGVRYSITNPRAYLKSNLDGFLNILEGCRHSQIKHLVYASSSSVYGANRKMPFSVHHNVDHPISLYAATKKSNELLAHSYSALYALPTTGLRFFTVYGPWGRPDMALFLFTKAILNGEPIEVFNEGNMMRDFTYVDDIVESIVRLLPLAPQSGKNWDPMHPDPSFSFAPYEIFNVGNQSQLKISALIQMLENILDRKAIIRFLPKQDSDVLEAVSDNGRLFTKIGFVPNTPLEEGIKKFVNWFHHYEGVPTNLI